MLISDSAVRGVVGRTIEDFQRALTHLVFSFLGGSPWVPRIFRRLIFQFAGASMKSAPGIRFTFNGHPANLSLGEGIYMNQRVFIDAIGAVRIGDGCALGMEVMIITSDHPIDASGAWREKAIGRAVTIGSRVWFGARAVVLPGVTIGDDVVVAAGSVVTRDCRSGGLYAGVPARRIRELGSPEQL